MAKLTEAEKDQVSSLANTSVDDMRSSLRCMPGHYSLAVLRDVLRIAKRRGEKTRVRIVEAEIKKMTPPPAPPHRESADGEGRKEGG